MATTRGVIPKNGYTPTFRHCLKIPRHSDRCIYIYTYTYTYTYTYDETTCPSKGKRSGTFYAPEPRVPGSRTTCHGCALMALPQIDTGYNLPKLKVRRYPSLSPVTFGYTYLLLIHPSASEGDQCRG